MIFSINFIINITKSLRKKMQTPEENNNTLVELTKIYKKHKLNYREIEVKIADYQSKIKELEKEKDELRNFCNNYREQINVLSKTDMYTYLIQKFEKVNKKLESIILFPEDQYEREKTSGCWFGPHKYEKYYENNKKLFLKRYKLWYILNYGVSNGVINSTADCKYNYDSSKNKKLEAKIMSIDEMKQIIDTPNDFRKKLVFCGHCGTCCYESSSHMNYKSDYMCKGYVSDSGLYNRDCIGFPSEYKMCNNLPGVDNNSLFIKRYYKSDCGIYFEMEFLDKKYTLDMIMFKIKNYCLSPEEHASYLSAVMEAHKVDSYKKKTTKNEEIGRLIQTEGKYLYHLGNQPSPQFMLQFR